MVFNTCGGCESGTEAFDHQHQFVNLRGDTTTVYMIDGETFTSLTLAGNYVARTYDLTAQETLDFFREIKKIYN